MAKIHSLVSFKVYENRLLVKFKVCEERLVNFKVCEEDGRACRRTFVPVKLGIDN